MNHVQLEKINEKINEYICYNKELLNITLLVDESDLYSPTASNDNKNDRDYTDSTKCERLLSKIYKKVKYALHITGTSHSLLYNITTKLTEDISIQIPISRVHKMKRSDNYYGLFNNKINFNTEKVMSWWNTTDEKTKNKHIYTIGEDYKMNIKNIIQHILNKSQNIYHSFLISEEKIRVNHLSLAKKILNDFSDLFVIIFNGISLELYLPQKHQKAILRYSQKDAESCKTGKRLFDLGGICSNSLDKHGADKLSNNYCYFKIDIKKFNIKQIYKILAMFFKEEPNINSRTVITITGKYGERGYSFTSDDYDKYQLHLTDQYFPCHVKNKNCTDISQRLRLQGKYTETSELTLWTSDELKDIIQKFYVPFIKKIEYDIMDCNNWEDIKNIIEQIIDDGVLQFNAYMKYIDVKKKGKNMKIKRCFEKKDDGFRLIPLSKITEDKIKDWCKKNGLPSYKCINEIENKNMKKITYKYFVKLNRSEVDIISNIPFDENKLKKICEKNNFNIPSKDWFDKRKINNYKCYMSSGWKKYTLEEIEANKYDGFKIDASVKRLFNIYYDNDNNKKYSIRYTTKKFILNTNVNINMNPVTAKKTPYIKENEIIKYSSIRSKYDNHELPKAYYWKTPDGWLYLHDESKEKNGMGSINITSTNSKTETEEYTDDDIVAADKITL